MGQRKVRWVPAEFMFMSPNWTWVSLLIPLENIGTSKQKFNLTKLNLTLLNKPDFLHSSTPGKSVVLPWSRGHYALTQFSHEFPDELCIKIGLIQIGDPLKFSCAAKFFLGCPKWPTQPPFRDVLLWPSYIRLSLLLRSHRRGIFVKMSDISFWKNISSLLINKKCTKT